ncbi:lysophospholipid acyltransferase family protein [Butyrivibrio sp. FCS014]|uniref:lysophospholipid acyltransferase family protein n=1 Tax=Butyrivibrio sp. FCS014 TaxID=1408304 RepID=UPI000463B398|nr:lysophospholipid acyltransferase family protein [Butyrivibrio sp. FCS014]
MIRTILIFIFLVIFLIVSLPMQLVLFIMHKFNDPGARKASLAIVSWAFNVILFIGGIKRVVIGEDNVPKDEAVLYVSNHRSIFDIVVTYPRVPGRTGYIAKQESMKLPVISFWMVYLDCLFLDRSDIRKGLEMVLTAIDKVKSGISIFIYPEGTRNKTDKPLGEFHKGSFKIAQKADCPIVPVVVNHTRDCFENHMPWVKKTTVVIEYCEPIRIKELDKDDQKNIDQYVKNIIEETYVRNENLEI